MGTTQRVPVQLSHHRPMASVEIDHIAKEFRTLLLGSSTGAPIRRREKKLAQRHKDVQKGVNKAPEVVVEFLAEAHNRGASPAKVVRAARFLVDYFTAKAKVVRTSWRSASQKETRLEGELNNLQCAIDLGDHSTPTLTKTVEEIDECEAALDELKDATLSELHSRAVS